MKKGSLLMSGGVTEYCHKRRSMASTGLFCSEDLIHLNPVLWFNTFQVAYLSFTKQIYTFFLSYPHIFISLSSRSLLVIASFEQLPVITFSDERLIVLFD